MGFERTDKNQTAFSLHNRKRISSKQSRNFEKEIHLIERGIAKVMTILLLQKVKLKAQHGLSNEELYQSKLSVCAFDEI